ncbi:MAG: hypothetical protein K8F91_22155 [Candidatus Obscuribacterales bacterium]|nr:hypothetical protein [Candidatus Obscuribacterales bacterium]
MNLTLEPVLRQLSGRNQLFLAFDRDGTLVPYADHPDKAVMDQDLKNVLAGLAGLPEVDVAIVSARSIKALERDFDSADKINLAGNYGLEIRLGDGGDFMEPSVVEALPELKEIMRALQPLTAEATGGILEDHGLSLCLHWHKVDESRMSLVREVVESIKQSLSCVRFHSYPTSFEFIADVDWTKADGLSVLEERLRLKEKDSFYFVRRRH